MAPCGYTRSLTDGHGGVRFPLVSRPSYRQNPNLDSDLHPLQFTAAEKQALIAFLRSLSGRIREGM